MPNTHVSKKRITRKLCFSMYSPLSHVNIYTININMSGKEAEKRNNISSFLLLFYLFLRCVPKRLCAYTQGFTGNEVNIIIFIFISQLCVCAVLHCTLCFLFRIYYFPFSFRCSCLHTYFPIFCIIIEYKYYNSILLWATTPAPATTD